MYMYLNKYIYIEILLFIYIYVLKYICIYTNILCCLIDLFSLKHVHNIFKYI